MLKHYIPLVTRITVWICWAHLWIIMCTIVYTNLEGYPSDGPNKPVEGLVKESDVLLKVLSDLKMEISDLKNDVEKKTQFDRAYETNSRERKKWLNRKHFRDVSKTYVFVLLSYTGIGSHGDMDLQTWRSQVFYLFSMPLGLIFYYMMIHQIAVEMFEVYAYSAVTACAQHSHPDWTLDQRELYEKFKVFLYASFLFVVCVYVFGLLGLLSTATYFEGAYRAMNMMFLVSGCEDLFPYTEIPHRLVALIMTILVFVAVLTFYTVLYSMFLMFRYNNFSEFQNMLCMYATDDESTEYSLLQAPAEIDDNDELKDTFPTTTEQDFWWDKEPQDDFEHRLDYHQQTFSNSTASSENDEADYYNDKPQLTIEISKLQPAPEIQLTRPTPSPDRTIDSNYLFNS